MTYMSSAKCLNNIKIFANLYNDQIIRENKDFQVRRTCNVAGNDMYDTLNDNFDALFLRSDEIDVSNDILHEFLNMCKEESFSDIMEELSRNVDDDLDQKLKEKLSVFINNKNNEKYNCDLCETSSSIEGDDEEIENEKCILKNSKITRNYSFFKNVEVDGSYQIDSEIDEITMDNRDTEYSMNQNILTEEEITEKIDNLIEDDLKRVENLELDVIKIIRKVKDISEIFSFTLNIMSKIVVKISLSAYYNFITYPKCWSELKERMQNVARRVFAFIINKNAILLLHMQFSKKIKNFAKQVIVLPHPKNFLINNVSYPMDNVERIINLPIKSSNQIQNTTLKNNRSSVINLNSLEDEYNRPSLNNENVSNNCGKTYYFGNKNIVISEIKDMKISSFKFSGKIDVTELCREIRKHLKEIKMRRGVLAEQILDASQKSIYTILAPRKEWNKLSKKGRESYIRLRAYLDCFENIKDNLNNTLNGDKDLNGCSIEDAINDNILDSSVDSFTINESKSKDYNEFPQSHFLKNQVQENTSTIWHQNNEGNLDNHLPRNICQNIKLIEKLPNGSLHKVLDIENVASEIRQILHDFNITPAIFSSMYLSSDVKIFEKIVFSPRECDFSSVEAKNCYLELKTFLGKHSLVKQTKEKFNRSSNDIIKNGKTPEHINNLNGKKFVFVPMKNNPYNSGNVNMKRKTTPIEDTKSNNKRLRMDDTTLNKATNLNSYQRFENIINVPKIEKNFINIVSTPNTLNSTNIDKDANINYESSYPLIEGDKTFSPSTNSIKVNDSKILSNHVDFDYLKSVRNNINLSNNLAFQDFYKKIMSSGYLFNANLNQMEVLCLAWTYNPNPLKVLSNYISELTMLPYSTIEIFYQKTNNLQSNIKNSLSGEIFRTHIRRCILEYTTRKTYLFITNLFFKQLFNGDLSSLICQI